VVELAFLRESIHSRAGMQVGDVLVQVRNEEEKR
jgi:hypothetical protein